MNLADEYVTEKWSAFLFYSRKMSSKDETILLIDAVLHTVLKLELQRTFSLILYI